MGKSDASSNGYLGEVRPATSLPLHAPATPRSYGSTARQILCAQQPAGTWPVGSAVCVPPTGRRTASNGSAVVSVAGNETFLDRPPPATPTPACRTQSGALSRNMRRATMARRARGAFEGPEGPERPGSGHKKAGFREPAFSCNGGEGGIRTHGTLARTLDFESSPFGQLRHLSGEIGDGGEAGIRTLEGR